MLPSHYSSLYDACKLTTDSGQLAQLDSICQKALVFKKQYQEVEAIVRIPWPLIAAIHFRESSQSFHRHLHNGDPLSARTVQVPQGRPFEGEPPFTWVESAIDAFQGFWRPQDWAISSCLEFLEHYNGLGYLKHGVNSPYLWDFTDQYSTGLYRSDGVFDPNAKESRAGCVAILKALFARGVDLDFSTLDAHSRGLH